MNSHRLRAPRTPVPVKYSDLARKKTCRGATSGMTMLSMNDRWLLARMTGPVCGTLSRPSITGRQITREIGESTRWVTA